jgi:hypothetical protein
MKKTIYSALFAAAMLFATTSAFAQVKIGTNPTTIEATSNLEVEASTAGRKVKVNKTTGQVTIADGTQGAGKVLTSDANGNARWNSTEEIKVPKTMFIGFQAAGEQLVTIPSQTGEITSRFKVVPLPNYSAGYNAARRAYVIPQAGYYRVEVGTRCTLNGAGTVTLALPGNILVSDNYTAQTAGNTVGKTFMHTQYYAAGAEVYGIVWAVTPATTGVITYNSYMTVTRLEL